MTAESSAAELENISMDVDDELAFALVDRYCQSLSAGSKIAYDEGLESRRALGADELSARQFATYQAVLHQSIERALEQALLRRQSLEDASAGLAKTDELR